MDKALINKYAYADEMPDVGLSCPDRCLWYALRDVYRRFRSGEISKEQGEKEKNRAIRQHELDMGEIDTAKKIIRRNADMWMEIERAANMYSMDRTLQNADNFVQAVYGVRNRQQDDGAAYGVRNRRAEDVEVHGVRRKE